MDEYAEEKTTEKNLIVRSGISEAETTNNKRLPSTFCIEAIQRRSIARPLCDSRASCFTSQVTGKIVCEMTYNMLSTWDVKRNCVLYPIFYVSVVHCSLMDEESRECGCVVTKRPVVLEVTGL